MKKRRPIHETPDAFDRLYRPEYVETCARSVLSSNSPVMFVLGKHAAAAQWITPAVQPIDTLYARRAVLLRRLAEGDESVRPEYEKTLSEIRELQAREADELREHMKRQDEQHDRTLALFDDTERFLQQHAHLVPST